MGSVSDEIARLAGASAHELRIEWRRHYRAELPVRLSRDLLLRAVAYKLQERAEGGLSQMAKRTLRHLAERLEKEDDGGADPVASLAPGARLVREWRGRSHAVTVLEDGFEFEGARYRSLSRIAELITGVHWSGPRFFGLVKEPAIGAGPRRTTASAKEPDDGQG